MRHEAWIKFDARYFPSGTLRSFIASSGDQFVVRGRLVRAMINSLVEFHDDGQLRAVTLSEGVSLESPWGPVHCRIGDRIEFSRNGMIFCQSETKNQKRNVELSQTREEK